MTHADLRRALLAERYGDVIREAHACLSHATPWTPAEQHAHRAEVVREAAAFDEAHRKARPRPYPPPSAEVRDAVVDDLPPKRRTPKAGYARGQNLDDLLGEWSV